MLIGLKVKLDEAGEVWWFDKGGDKIGKKVRCGDDGDVIATITKFAMSGEAGRGKDTYQVYHVEHDNGWEHIPGVDIKDRMAEHSRKEGGDRAAKRAKR